jgi:hypothetical protein
VPQRAARRRLCSRCRGMTADGCLRRTCTPGWPLAARSAGDRGDGLPELDCMAVQLGGHARQARKGLITKREVQQPVASAGRPAPRIIPGHPRRGRLRSAASRAAAAADPAAAAATRPAARHAGAITSTAISAAHAGNNPAASPSSRSHHHDRPTNSPRRFPRPGSCRGHGPPAGSGHGSSVGGVCSAGASALSAACPNTASSAVAGEHFTRHQLPLVQAAGFQVVETERLKAGPVERIHAVKPACPRPPAGFASAARQIAQLCVDFRRLCHAAAVAHKAVTRAAATHWLATLCDRFGR